MGLMIRDPRTGRTGGRRSTPNRGAVRVTPKKFTPTNIHTRAMATGDCQGSGIQ